MPSPDAVLMDRERSPWRNFIMQTSRPRTQCATCGRCLGRPRMCVVSLDAEHQCLLCGHLCAVMRAVRCTICGRCLCRARMSLVSPDAEEQCDVCSRLCAVRNAVPISLISAADEERALALLMEVLALLQGEWEPADFPPRAMQYAAVQGAALAGLPPGQRPLPRLTRRWRRGVLSDAPQDVP